MKHILESTKRRIEGFWARKVSAFTDSEDDEEGNSEDGAELVTPPALRKRKRDEQGAQYIYCY